jgi:hypothetical protein
MKNFTNVKEEKNTSSDLDPRKVVLKLDLTNNFATDYYTTFR